MRDYKITNKEYKDYLSSLRNSIFRILPLYEEKSEYLDMYINDTITKLIYLKYVIPELIDGYWYVETCCSIEELEDKIHYIQHSNLRRKILNMTNLISVEITNCESRDANVV